MRYTLHLIGTVFISAGGKRRLWLELERDSSDNIVTCLFSAVTTGRSCMRTCKVDAQKFYQFSTHTI